MKWCNDSLKEYHVHTGSALRYRPGKGQPEGQDRAKAHNQLCDPFINVETFHDQVAEITGQHTRSRTDAALVTPTGRCSVRLTDGTELHGTWRAGQRDGSGGISSPQLEQLGVRTVLGNYVDGVLHGVGRYYLKGLFTNFEYITFFSCPTKRNIFYKKFISIKQL